MSRLEMVRVHYPTSNIRLFKEYENKTVYLVETDTHIEIVTVGNILQQQMLQVDMRFEKKPDLLEMISIIQGYLSACKSSESYALT